MSILSDGTLLELLPKIIREPDPLMVNPASIDIRIGHDVQYEDGTIFDLRLSPYRLEPKEFVLVSTYEHITIPNGYVAELKLKSTRAREGFDHSLAFYIDPGWEGILTMEVMNNHRLRALDLVYGQRFGQLIIHTLDKPALHPYSGKYKGATSVEAAKL